MKFSLFTTQITKSCYKEENKLFLGKWCSASEIDLSRLGDFKTALYHWDDFEKINKDHKYLYNFYYQILDILSKKLNKLHKKDKDRRYWHIIIGTWLYRFLISSYDKWESLRIVFQNYDISKIFYYETHYLDLIPSDCTEFEDALYYNMSELWNNFLYTEIAKFQKKNLNYEKIDYKINKNKKNYVLNKFSKKSNFFYNYLDKFLSLIPLKPEIVLYKTYFKKISNFKIFLKSSTIPRIYTEFEKKIKLPSPKSRDKLYLDFNTKNNFEEFIKKNIFKFMPVSYIEGFQEIDNYCKNIKLNPKFIISAVGDKNDSFAIWIANNIGKSKYFCSEHGGTQEDTEHFDARNKKADCFLSWNFSEKKNVHQITPQFYTKKIKQDLLKKGNRLSIIMTSPSSIYSYHLNYDLKGTQVLDVYNQMNGLKKLSSKIKDNLRFRLHPNNFAWQMDKRILKDFGENFIFKDKKLDDVFMESKILINLDFQTSFYQSMFSGKPVIIFTNRKLTNTFNPKIKKLFESFEESKIIITKISDLILHIENIWSDPYKWWDSYEVKNLREKFNSLCSKKPNNSFVDEIIKLKKKYE